MAGPDPTDRRRKFTRRACAIAAWSIVVFSTANAAVGIDYGRHWDEWAHVQGITRCLERLSLFPQSYYYNGFYFYPGFLAIAIHDHERIVGIPHEILSRSATVEFNPERFPTLRYVQHDLPRWVESNDYKLLTRRIFIALSLPAILWIFYAFARLFRDRWPDALAAAAFIGLSWEVVTTSRHIAVDAPLMQFTALQMLALAFARRPRGPVGYLVAMIASGVAAGFAAGSKTTGVIAVVVSLVATFTFPCPWSRLRVRLAVACAVLVAFFTAFFVSTPQDFIDPIRYFAFTLFSKLDYNSVGPGYPYYVDAPFEHWGRLALYLLTAVPSYFIVPAAALSLVVLRGFHAWWKQDWRSLVPWLVWLALYLFVLRDVRLLQIRNNMMLVPMFAIAFGVGVASLRDLLLARVHRLAHHGFVAVLVGIFALNAGWIVYTAWTIPNTTRETIRRDAAEYVKGSLRRARVSPRVRDALSDALQGFTCRPAAARAEPGTSVLLYFDDHPATQWLANRQNFVDRTFASMEINYDWYSTWRGRFEHDRIIALPVEHAAEMSLDMSRYVDCSR